MSVGDEIFRSRTRSTVQKIDLNASIELEVLNPCLPDAHGATVEEIQQNGTEEYEQSCADL